MTFTSFFLQPVSQNIHISTAIILKFSVLGMTIQFFDYCGVFLLNLRFEKLLLLYSFTLTPAFLWLSSVWQMEKSHSLGYLMGTSDESKDEKLKQTSCLWVHVRTDTNPLLDLFFNGMPSFRICKFGRGSVPHLALAAERCVIWPQTPRTGTQSSSSMFSWSSTHTACLFLSLENIIWVTGSHSN